jgi:hypothetical protein
MNANTNRVTATTVDEVVAEARSLANQLELSNVGGAINKLADAVMQLSAAVDDLDADLGAVECSFDRIRDLTP